MITLRGHTVGTRARHWETPVAKKRGKTGITRPGSWVYRVHARFCRAHGKSDKAGDVSAWYWPPRRQKMGKEQNADVLAPIGYLGVKRWGRGQNDVMV